jgi:X-X-X-Leu-X-X-Gly heptad repeat protein
MNRTLLLIVADFLLLSLLALANFEESGEVATGDGTGEGRTAAASGPDPAMVDLLASALAAEQETQSSVQEELAQTRSALRELRAEREQLGEALAAERQRLRAQEEALAAREAELSAARQREEEARRQAQVLDQARETAEQRAARLAGEREELERRRRELQAQLETTATDREQRSEELVARERELARLEEQLDASRAELERARREREAAEQEKEALAAERERLARQAEERQRELAVVAANLEETRERLVSEQAVRERMEERAAELSTGVTRLSTGVTELSTGVTELSTGVTELAEANRSIEESVRELQPVSANEVFVRSRERTVEVVFQGRRASLLGSGNFREVIPTNLVRIGDRAYLFLSVEQTPLRNAAEGPRIRSLSVRLQTRMGGINLGALQRTSADPSLLYASFPVAVIDSLGVEPFPLDPNPLGGGQATLVDLVDDRFGESDYRLEPGRANFAEIDRRTFSALFGEFSAGPGDLAFSRQGRWIGVVTTPGSLWIGEEPEPESTLPLGPDFMPALLRR